MPTLLNGRKRHESEATPLQADVLKQRHSPEFLHVHVCVYCRHARTREEISGREMGSGIFHCPNCESNGPLNIEILDRRGNPMQ